MLQPMQAKIIMCVAFLCALADCFVVNVGVLSALTVVAVSTSPAANYVAISLNAVPPQDDLTAPTVTIVNETIDCSLRAASECAQQRWRVHLTFNDSESGLADLFLRTDSTNDFYDTTDINFTSDPFSRGSRNEIITGQLEATCCVTYVEICAIDVASNLKKLIYKVPVKIPMESIVIFQIVGIIVFMVLISAMPIAVVFFKTNDHESMFSYIVHNVYNARSTKCLRSAQS